LDSNLSPMRQRAASQHAKSRSRPTPYRTTPHSLPEPGGRLQLHSLVVRVHVLEHLREGRVQRLGPEVDIVIAVERVVRRGRLEVASLGDGLFALGRGVSMRLDECSGPRQGSDEKSGRGDGRPAAPQQFFLTRHAHLYPPAARQHDNTATMSVFRPECILQMPE
jgi:hypothetical protein